MTYALFQKHLPVQSRLDQKLLLFLNYVDTLCQYLHSI